MKYTWEETLALPVDYRNRFIKHLQKKAEEQNKKINKNNLE